MTTIINNSQIILDGYQVHYYDDVCVEVAETEDDEALVVLKNPLPELIAHVRGTGAPAAVTSYFFASATDVQRPLLSHMKSRKIINPHLAERLTALLDGYIEVQHVDTAYGPAILVPSPHAIELSAEALIPLIEKRYIKDMDYFSVVIDAEPVERDEDDGVDRYFVRVIEKSMNDDDYKKHDAESSSDGIYPFAVVTKETLDTVRERYSCGIIGEMFFDMWAFRSK